MRQIAGRHLGEPHRRPDESNQVLARLEVGHREQIRHLGGQPQIGADPRSLVIGRRLEEQIVGAVGYVGHPVLAGRKGFQQPMRC